jgi:hypothetical protein
MKQMILIVALFWAYTTNTVWAEQNNMGASLVPEEVREDCTVMETNGCVDWSKGIIYATGMGVPNPNFKSVAQRSYSALEAAKVVAMRNLLQMVEGINISSSRTVKAGMLENDTIQTQISGKLTHVQETGRPRKMNDGSVWVTVKMYLRDIVSVLVNNDHFILQESTQHPVKQVKIPPEEKPSNDTQFGGSADVIYTGLIIDASEVGVVPAMSPKINDTEGREVYGSAAVQRDFALQHGIVGYVKDLKSANSDERVKGNPLRIKAKRSENNSVDLIISKEDATLLRKLEATQTFLREARVVIIIG